MVSDGDDSENATPDVEPGLPEFSPGWAVLFMLLGAIATLVVLVAVGALPPEFVRSAMVPLGAFAVAVAAVWWVLEALRER